MLFFGSQGAPKIFGLLGIGQSAFSGKSRARTPQQSLSSHTGVRRQSRR